MKKKKNDLSKNTVHSISIQLLIEDGWSYYDKNIFYKKGQKIICKGFEWDLNGRLIQFMEEIK